MTYGSIKRIDREVNNHDQIFCVKLIIVRISCISQLLYLLHHQYCFCLGSQYMYVCLFMCLHVYLPLSYK